MYSKTIAAAVAAAHVLAAAPIPAQSLAEAARLAEEQRATAGASSKVYSNATLGGATGYAALLGDNFLLKDHFDAYASARVRIAQYRLSHYDLDLWMQERIARAKDRFDLEAIYGQDRSVLQALGRMTPRDYFKTDLAYARAVEDARLTPADRDANLPSARAANAQYVDSRLLHNWGRTIKAEQDLETRRATYKPAYRR